jgi:hypothetical protein
MPFTCEAIFACGDYENGASQAVNFFRTTKPPPVYFLISGATAGTRYETVCSGTFNSQLTDLFYPISPTTCGASIAQSGYFTIPANLALNGQSISTGRNAFGNEAAVPNVPCAFNATILDGATEVFSVTTVFGSNTRQMGTWVVSKSNSSIFVTCTSYGTANTIPVFVPYVAGVQASLTEIPEIWKVSIKDKNGNEIASNMVNAPVVTRYPETIFPASVISVTDTYSIEIEKRNFDSAPGTANRATVLVAPTFDIQRLQLYTTLTAGTTVTSGESSNMYSWLDNSYWYLTDLQVNLGTRAVTHRHGAIQLRPADTINFAILFHDGTAGINPQATDIKLAVRSSNNTSPYHFWSATTVSTVTVSGDVYYAITVTASDDDLLTAQAANLLAGSNADQSLLGEIQWTTTRGTFSSDTFTINVPSEVVREPDV